MELKKTISTHDLFYLFTLTLNYCFVLLNTFFKDQSFMSFGSI